jgi:hypothetical protein
VIPDYLTRDHVLAAIAKIDRAGIPAGRFGTKYAVFHDGRHYPPKLLISLAHEEVKGVPYPSSLFGGGRETNGFLQRLGFTVIEKHEGAVLSQISSLPKGPPPQPTLTTCQIISTAEIERIANDLVRSAQIFTWSELKGSSSLPPQRAGIYAWFFKQCPPQVPIDGCVQREGRTLLYVGVSPESLNSSSHLRNRIREHFSRTAEGSTLRKTLGCLLEKELGTILRCVGDHNRMTFSTNEERLSEWMVENAGVAWVEVALPWEVEPHLIQSISVPLNLDSNATNPFYEKLKSIRSKARERAKELPRLER